MGSDSKKYSISFELTAQKTWMGLKNVVQNSVSIGSLLPASQRLWILFVYVYHILIWVGLPRSHQVWWMQNEILFCLFSCVFFSFFMFLFYVFFSVVLFISLMFTFSTAFVINTLNTLCYCSKSTWNRFKCVYRSGFDIHFPGTISYTNMKPTILQCVILIFVLFY